MQRDDGPDEDATWRAIVENYGERATVDPDPTPLPDQPADRPDQAGDPHADPYADPYAEQPVDDPEWFTAPLVDPEERFVPPAPPPLPRPSYDRLAAWAGVFGSPSVLLLCLLASIDLPELVAYVLVAGFVGGFGYLVWQMPRGPRDPWDDGAQV